MRIAVITSIFGDIDKFHEFPVQTVDHEFFFYNEKNLSVSGSFKDFYANSYKAKYPKFQTHKLLPGFDAYIWIDGSFEVRSDKFIEYMLVCLGENDMWIRKHPLAGCLYHEAMVITECLKNKNTNLHTYLKKRFLLEDIEREVNFYKEVKFPAAAGMWQGGIFIRKNNTQMNHLFDLLWKHVLKYSPKDQLAIAYYLNTLKLNFSDRDVVCTSEIIRHNSHFN